MPKIVDEVAQLKKGQRVTVSRKSPTNHPGCSATVLDWDKWGGRYGIKEAIWIRFDCGCLEHRSPGSLIA